MSDSSWTTRGSHTAVYNMSTNDFQKIRKLNKRDKIIWYLFPYLYTQNTAYK